MKRRTEQPLPTTINDALFSVEEMTCAGCTRLFSDRNNSFLDLDCNFVRVATFPPVWCPKCRYALRLAHCTSTDKQTEPFFLLCVWLWFWATTLSNRN